MKNVKQPSSLLRDTRGAIMAEGVIVLPVFIITLAAIMYFHNIYAAKLDRSVKARSCAWTYAVHGCDDEFLAEGCMVSEVHDGLEAIGGHMSGGNVFEQSQAREQSRNQGEQKSELDTGLAGANRVGLGLLGLREGVQARSSREVKRPSLLGGSKTIVTSNYTVMCNEKERTPFELVIDSYCALGSEMGFPGC